MKKLLQRKVELSQNLIILLMSFFRPIKDYEALISINSLAFLFKRGLLKGYTLVMISFLLLFSTTSWSQSTSIWNNPITGSNPGQQNPYIIGDVSSPYVTVSGIGQTGLNGQNGNNVYNVDGFSTSGSINTSNDYFSFIITPNAGYNINFNSFIYTATRQTGGSGGPSNYSFRSSTTSYGTSIGSPNSTGTTLSLTNASYQNIDGAIQFRFYGWNSSNTNGDFSINDFDFTGGILGTTATSLSDFSTCIGTAGTAQSFMVNGQGLSSATATITVAGSTNYEVSKTSATSGFGSSVTFNASGGSVSQTIWVRLKASASSGTYTESIAVSGGGFIVSNGIGVSCSGTVNPLPSSGTVSASSYVICNGNTINLSANATSNSSTSVTLIDEDFNAPTNSWTKINNSTGGTTSAAAWTLRTNGYVYGTNTFISNDASQFYLSNSDAQGSGSTTETILQSPVMNTMGMNSLSLNYFHYFRYNSGTDDRARVEVSTNGTSWTAITTYSSTQGLPGTFNSVTTSLNSYVNQPTVYIRYRYNASFDWYWAIDNVKVSGVYTAPPAPTYSWTSTPSGFSSTLQNPTNVMPLVNTTYTVTITNSFGCSIALTTPTVVVNQKPTLSTITQMATVCEGSLATFNLTGLLPNTTSTLNYTLNGSPQTATGVISNGSGTASFTKALLLSYNAQNVVVTTITRTDVTPNCPVTVNVINVLSVNQNVTYYQDFDGDSFGNPLMSQVSCFGTPVGYVLNNTDCNDNQLQYLDADGDGFGSLTLVACGVLNNTDCNDGNIAIYQSAPLFTDADGDGYTVGVAVVTCYGATLPVGTSLTSLGSDCDDNNATMHATYPFYVDADGDTYGTGSLVNVCAVNGTTPPTGYSLNNTDCDDTNGTIYPGAPEICFDGILQNCNGTLTDGCAPVLVNMIPSYCGGTLPYIFSTVGAYEPNLPVGTSETSYRFEITNLATFETRVLERPIRTFNLTMTNICEYSTTYLVRVAVKVNAEWQPYGDVCIMNTPGIPTTQVISTTCGTILPLIASTVGCNSVNSAVAYRFRIVNAGNTSEIQTIERLGQTFKLTQLTEYPVQYNTSYIVSVQVKVLIDGNQIWSNYGTPCTITTPTFPTTQVQLSQCELVATSNTEVISADNYPNATVYRFRLTNTALSYSQIVDRPNRTFTLSMFTGLTAGTTYTVAVSIKFNGVFGPYGKNCSVTTPGIAPPMVRVNDITTKEFSVVAFPNPFTNTFALDIKTSSSEMVHVSVYDMMGRLLEVREGIADDLLDYNIGDRYPSGVYNIVVKQEADVKTVRVVKK